MEVTEEIIDIYLREVRQMINNGCCMIALNREKNMELFHKYVLDEERSKEILLDLDVKDFSHILTNRNIGYEHEQLYVFGKDIKLIKRYEEGEEVVSLYIKINKIKSELVVVISFHKQEYPLKYMFK